MVESRSETRPPALRSVRLRFWLTVAWSAAVLLAALALAPLVGPHKINLLDALTGASPVDARILLVARLPRVLMAGLADAHDVRAITRRKVDFPSTVADLQDLDDLVEAFSGLDAVIHLAATVSPGHRADLAELALELELAPLERHALLAHALVEAQVVPAGNQDGDPGEDPHAHLPG